MSVELETAKDAVWLLSYYDGSFTKTCIIDSLPVELIDNFVSHLNDDLEYMVNTMVELHLPSQLDSNNPYAFKVFCDDVDLGYSMLKNIRDLPCYRFVTKQDEWGAHLIDHLGAVAGDF